MMLVALGLGRPSHQCRHRVGVIIGEQVRIDAGRCRHLVVAHEPADFERRYPRGNAQTRVGVAQL
jgi:hypothetical protein